MRPNTLRRAGPWADAPTILKTPGSMCSVFFRAPGASIGQNIDKFWPELAKSGPALANIGQTWCRFGKSWTLLVHIQPNLAQVGQILAQVGVGRARLTQSMLLGVVFRVILE